MPGRRKAFAEGAADRARRKRLRRAQRSSWYLAGLLGYHWNPKLQKGLTERIHKPIMDWYDRHRDDERIGIWKRRKLGHKTTMVITWIIQEWLRDPNQSQGYFHAVDELAEGVVSEVKQKLQRCGKLRALDPVGIFQEDGPDKGGEYRIFPGPTGRPKNGHNQTWTAHKIYLNRERYSRSPSLVAKGTNSEVTGAHFDGPVWLDDVISRSTIINSQLGATENWIQNTIVPISDLVWRSTGTPWSDMSVHQKWMASPQWRTLVLPAAIDEPIEAVHEALASRKKKIHFKPSYKFGDGENPGTATPMFWPEELREEALERLRTEQESMEGEFSPQIMCDAEPKKERFWSQSACERFTGIKPGNGMIGITMHGVNVVLSDPAPHLLGGVKNDGEKKRGDGSKDYWSICVVRCVVHGQSEIIILLDGDRSREWGIDQGCDQIARMMAKWRTPYYVSEQPKQYFDPVREACMRIGTPCTVSRKGGPWIFDDYNRVDGKNARFERLSEKARAGLVYICSETCPDDYLYGDGDHTGVLTQARKWRRTGQGKNSLRFDDDADVFARATDGVLKNFTPRAAATQEDFFDQLFRREEEPEPMRTQYMGM